MLSSASGYGYDCACEYDFASSVRDDKNKSFPGCVRYENEYRVLR